jgi:hypothetical protein
MRRSERGDGSAEVGGSLLPAIAGSFDRAVRSDAMGVFQSWTLEPEKAGFPRCLALISKGRPDCQAKYPAFPHI